MSVAVRYYTRTGNTKKLADAIAKVAEVEAKEITAPLEEKVDILFLGASVYGYAIDENIKAYIKSLKPEQVGKVVVFSTSALAERAFPEVEKFIKETGVKVDPRNFYCRGSFMVLHKGRPNEQDIASAERFAKDILGK